MLIDLEQPLLNTRELLACVPGLSHDSFKQWLKRGTLRLKVEAEIGRGKRPLYPGIDVIQVASLLEMSKYTTIPQSKFREFWSLVESRLFAIAAYDEKLPEMVMFLFLNETTLELSFVAVVEGGDVPEDILNAPTTPDMLAFFRVDRFIKRMIERMKRAKAGYSAEESAPPPERGDFDVDSDGRRVLVGLSREETEELIKLMSADDLPIEGKKRRDWLDFRHQESKSIRELSLIPKPGEYSFFIWSTDSDGCPALVGLNAAETKEFIQLKAKISAYRLVQHFSPWLTREEEDADKKREMYLINKYKRATIDSELK